MAESLKGAVFASAFFRLAGFHTYPAPDAARGDIVQTIELRSPESLITYAFARLFRPPRRGQFVDPRRRTMPGYQDPVIMAAGTFIRASIELSADGPMREPYPAYLQGELML